MGYGLCIKLPKTCEKRPYKHIKVLVIKRYLEETVLYSNKETVLKITKNGHSARTIAQAKY